MLSGVLLVLLPSKKIAAARGLLPQVAFRIASDPSIYFAFLVAAGGVLKITKENIFPEREHGSPFFFLGAKRAAPKNAK